jgi:hypothetical protein
VSNSLLPVHSLVWLLLFGAMPPPSEVEFSHLLLLGIALMVMAAGVLIVFFIVYQKRLHQQ